MLGLLQSIVETITLIVQFLVNAFVGLINFILMIPTYFTFTVGLVDVVPSFAQAFFIGGITLTIILFIINRQAA